MSRGTGLPAVESEVVESIRADRVSTGTLGVFSVVGWRVHFTLCPD